MRASPSSRVDAVGDIVATWMDPATNVVHARRYTAATGMWGTIDDLTPATIPRTRSCCSRARDQPGRRRHDRLGFDTIVERGGRCRPGADANAGHGRGMDAGCSSRRRPRCLRRPAARRRRRRERDARVGRVPDHELRFLFVSSTSRVVREATRPPSSDVWQGALTLSDPTLISDSPRVATTPAGEVTVAWTESAAHAIKVVTRPVGGVFPPASSTTIIVPQDKPISSGLFLGIPITTLRIADGPSGTVVAFGRQDGTNSLAEAVFRPAGGSWPNPATTPPTALSAPGTDIGLGDSPSLTMDGLGNAVATWTRGSVIQAAASTPRLPRSPRSTSPRPARRVSRSQHRRRRSTPGRRSARGSRAGTSVTASSPPARRSPMSTPRPGRTP